jgi:hypothetical protein
VLTAPADGVPAGGAIPPEVGPVGADAGVLPLVGATPAAGTAGATAPAEVAAAAADVAVVVIAVVAVLVVLVVPVGGASALAPVVGTANWGDPLVSVAALLPPPPQAASPRASTPAHETPSASRPLIRMRA